MRYTRKLCDGLSGVAYRFALKRMRLIKTAAKPRLLTFLEDGSNRTFLHVGHQQFHGVGPDINYSTTRGNHGARHLLKLLNERRKIRRLQLLVGPTRTASILCCNSAKIASTGRCPSMMVKR